MEAVLGKASSASYPENGNTLDDEPGDRGRSEFQQLWSWDKKYELCINGNNYIPKITIRNKKVKTQIPACWLAEEQQLGL